YNAYQSIKYPPIKTLRKAPQPPSKPLAAPKSKARIQVPRVGGRFASGGSEKSPPNKGIKSKSRIEEELKKSRPVDVVLPPGRDVEAEKDRLAELNQFAGGALGLPKVSLVNRAGADPREKTKPDGAGTERDRMFEELKDDIKVKQERLMVLSSTVETESRRPAPPPGTQAARNRLKRMTAQKTELLQLENDLERHVKDLDALAKARNAAGRI
ncbi:hypothetical protein FOZ63_024371, partial [Perkinsus olseni]